MKEKKYYINHYVLLVQKIKINVSVAMQYTDSYSENIVSFVNDVKTSDGGSHEVGFKTCYYEST